jgi:hypothetical protein
MLSLFTVLAILLRAVGKEIAAHSSVLRVHLDNVGCWNTYFSGCQKLDIPEAERHGVAAAIELGVVQLRVAIGLCPFAETEPVIESHPTKITEGGQIRIRAVDMWL